MAMTPKEITRRLRAYQEKYKNAVEPVPVENFSGMVKDIADAMDQLQNIVDMFGKLPTCNTCINPNCMVRPEWGKSVRYNCSGYMGIIYDNTLN